MSDKEFVENARKVEGPVDFVAAAYLEEVERIMKMDELGKLSKAFIIAFSGVYITLMSPAMVGAYYLTRMLSSLNLLPRS